MTYVTLDNSSHIFSFRQEEDGCTFINEVMDRLPDTEYAITIDVEDVKEGGFAPSNVVDVHNI